MFYNKHCIEKRMYKMQKYSILLSLSDHNKLLNCKQNLNRNECGCCTVALLRSNFFFYSAKLLLNRITNLANFIGILFSRPY